MIIRTERQYKQVLEEVDFLMKKGEDNLSIQECRAILNLGAALEKWEDEHDGDSNSQLDTDSKKEVSG